MRRVRPTGRTLLTENDHLPSSTPNSAIAGSDTDISFGSMYIARAFPEAGVWPTRDTKTSIIRAATCDRPHRALGCESGRPANRDDPRSNPAALRRRAELANLYNRAKSIPCESCRFDNTRRGAPSALTFRAAKSVTTSVADVEQTITERRYCAAPLALEPASTTAHRGGRQRFASARRPF